MLQNVVNSEDLANGEAYSPNENYAGMENCRINSGSLKQYDQAKEPKLYKERFLMMFLFCLCTLLNGFQWIQFSIIASILICYYDVTIETINLTSVLFMAMYIPFLYPVMWMMQNKGLRFVLILAAAGNTLSACVQCFSLPNNRFDIVLVSQTMASIAQCFSVSVAPFISAIWFGSKEVSRACAVGVFSNQLGVALSYLIAPLLVPSNCHDTKDVKQGLSNLAVGQAVINAIVFLGIMFFLKDKPPTPPSVAEAIKPEELNQVSTSLRILFKNVYFSLFILPYGILNSVFAAVAVALNQMIVKTFPGKEVDAGRIGMASILSGMLGTLIAGYILDKTHRYRMTAMTIYVISLLLMATYTIIASIKSLWLHYLLFSLMGFFMFSYMTVGYEFGIEISYPVPEGITGSILCASFQFLGIITTFLGSWLEQTFSGLASNIFFCCLIAFGLLVSIFIKCENKRNDVIKSESSISESYLTPSI